MSIEKKEESVAVAIDRDKGSQYALKWTVDHLLSRGQALTLLHVKQKTSSIPTPMGNHVAISEVKDDVARTYKLQLENQAKEMFLPFRCFCTRKNIKCNEVILEDSDIPKTLINYVSSNLIEVLVLGAPSRSGLVKRFKTTDVPSSVTKVAPDFCTVYVIAKGKIASIRSATSSLPAKPPPTNNRIEHLASHNLDSTEAIPTRQLVPRDQRQVYQPRLLQDEYEIKSPFNRGRVLRNKSYESSMGESDISFVSSGRPSVERSIPCHYDNLETGFTPQLYAGSEYDSGNFQMLWSGSASGSSSNSSQAGFSSGFSSLSSGFSSGFSSGSSSQESPMSSWSSHSVDDAEAEMRRLKLELRQTMDMYSTACREAISAKQMAKELRFLKLEEEQRLEEARMAEEAAIVIAERERVKFGAATEAAEAAKRIAELEAKKRVNAGMKALRESEERETMQLQGFSPGEVRYRRYSIEEIEAATQDFSDSLKVGEGGYGPVYVGELDHTQVAIKVLRPDAAQGRSQFQQEVEVLSCIRHPNMVLLLGACPEYGCLVYEFMANGSLEDRLFRQGNTPVLPWQFRFRISAEIGTALLFLHNTKPEPLVHRDLKPGNILLDRNFVSKISDVGLARLVPPSVADTVTQYRMTSTAGTFCYIDPEYQQTGLLGIKSDVYSLGVMLLQIITAKPPMGLTHLVERAIERGTFAETLDPAVPEWPVEEALSFAKMALKCAEMRKKDRPDLGKVVLPELNRLRKLAENSMTNLMLGQRPLSPSPSPSPSPGRNHYGSSNSQPPQRNREDLIKEIESRNRASSSPFPASSARTRKSYFNEN